MRRELLDELVAARRAMNPVVLVRGLSTGRQFIVLPDRISGDIEGLGRDLRDAARDALDLEGARIFETGEDRYLLQSLGSPPRLLIVGAVHIAQALIPMALRLHYDICLIDPRSAFANAERFPGIAIDNRWPHEAMPDQELDSRSAVVTLSHDPKIDEPALQAAMDSDAFYIGALGSKGNHAKRMERLAERGYSPQQLARIFGPIGLPLGGRAPAEIAVAILAQIVQERSKKLNKQGSNRSFDPE